jgi:hypothetical protein
MTHMHTNKKRSIFYSRAFVAFVACSSLLLTGCDNITPEQAIALLNNPTRPDARREGIAALATRWPFGKQPPYPQKYRDLAQHDPDVIVRAMAIRALNICRDAGATKIFVAGLKDESEQIRLESAKALANVPDGDAIPGLLDLLSGTRSIVTPNGRTAVAESKDVRIAAADALRQYRTVDVARSLISYLNEQDFGVAWQSRQSLIKLTGQDLHYDEAAWLAYIVGSGKPFG